MKTSYSLPASRASGPKRIVFMALLLAGLTGCQLVTSPSLAPTPTAPSSLAATPTANSLQPTPTPLLPTLTPAVEAFVSPTPPEITPTQPPADPQPSHPNLSERLTTAGPWLVIWSSRGLYAVNEDGSGLTRLTTEDPDGEQTLRLAASPDGRTFAYITGNVDRIHNLKLNIITLPEGESHLVTALTNKNTEPGADAVMDDKVNAVRAIIDEKSIAWSPDGKTLAFIGVQDGPSADLYSYVPTTGKITRLTDGPSQAYGPSWSPDGKYIVQYGVTGFGTGAGYSMAGAWAVRADDSGVIDLGKPGGAGETLVGWLDNDSFVTYSWTPICGPENLRVINISENTQSRLIRGCFGGAAMAGNRAILVVGSSSMGGELSGIYMIGPDNIERRKLSDDEAGRVESIADGIEFRVDTNTDSRVYSNTGELMSTSPRVKCSYGMGVGSFGMIYGWTCAADQSGDTPGAWINGPGIPEYQVFNAPAYAPTMSWTNNFIFFSGSTLYRAFFFDYIPEEVATLEGDVLDVMWVRKWE